MALTLSTNSRLVRALSVLGALAVFSGCSATSSPPDDWDLPQFEVLGSMSREYNGIADLADISSAIIIATPTGETFKRPLPTMPGAEEQPAAVPYVRMTIIEVLGGAISARGTIDVVSPGIDLTTGKDGLSSYGPYLLFITPAMLDKGQPFGGYVVTGGPNGVFAATNSREPDRFRSAFHAENRTLPESIIVGDTKLPSITHTEEELLEIGPQ